MAAVRRNPARKPAPDAALANELAVLAGGAEKLAARAQTLANAGELRLACHLVEFAVRAAPEQKSLLEIRAAIYQQRRDSETSLMAKGIFGAAAGESLAAAGIDDPHRQ
jgi:alkyl sulfatase BDS1-like metallo-beta-lactamase superfamily hydrolase